MAKRKKTKASKGKEKNIALWIIGICVLYVIFKVITYLNGIAFFDEGVYVGIAKYFASSGTVGYFESIRPLALPVLLIPIQFIQANPFITGRILGLVLTLVSVPIAYYVAKTHFGKRAGLWAALLFAANAAIINFGGYILTDVFAYILMILAVSLLLSKRYFWAGIVLSVAFLFKFPAMVILPVLVVYILIVEKKKMWWGLVKFILGVIIAALPYFIFNAFHYTGSFIQRLFGPLIEASVLVENQTWLYAKSSLSLYLSRLFTYEILLIIFAVVALVYCFKKHKAKMILFIVSILLFLFYFSFKVPRFDIRYIFPVLFFLMIMSGAGIAEFLRKIRSRKKRKYWTAGILVVILAVAVFATVNVALKGPIKSDSNIRDAVLNYKGSLVTNSAFPLLYADGKTQLMPGPNLGHTYLTYRLDNKTNWLIINPHAYPCFPNDVDCVLKSSQRINHILENNNIFSCGYLHGSKLIILTKKIGVMAKSKCLESIEHEEVAVPEIYSFIRVTSIEFDQHGNLQNNEHVRALVRAIEKNNVPAILILTPTEIQPNTGTQNWLTMLPENIEIGVMPAEGVSTQEFMQSIEALTGKRITVINPVGDDWLGKEIDIPKGIEYCVRGSWDKIPVPVPCRAIDMSIVKDWQTQEFWSLSEFKDRYGAHLDADIEIGVDIPAKMLNDQNSDAIKGFVEYISQIQNT
jgi:4-amino-4-deoxy-L-arabinose transferase-like glycosyltransferase